MKPRVLFILKFRDNPYEFQSSCDHDYGHKGKGLSSGLLNSAKFVVNMLAEQHIDVKLVQVIDNNDIDREVHQYQPTHVIIEALWVVPEKFDILHRLHPNVKWIVRLHSEIPFLAQEGVAFKWIPKYVQFENVSLAANSLHALHDLRSIIRAANPTWDRQTLREKVLYLPNFYPHHKKCHPLKEENEFIDIACFGAIRPLKNHLIQAVAAIRYARIIGKTLRFHINATRNEQGGNNVLKNLRALFNAVEADGHQLIEHGWMPHHEFLRLLRQMDMALQVSFSETFNIVAADCVVTGLPIVVSPEVNWASSWSQAEPTDSDDILSKMITANDWRFRWALKALNMRGLRQFCERSKHVWLAYLRG